MATEKIVYLEYDEAVWFHFELMWAWNETRVGDERRDLIESALARPRASAVYEDADIIRQAASLCFGLVKNHPWRGGKKRTVTHLMRIFLLINGCQLNYEIEEMLEMVLAVESDAWKVDEIENWLRNRTNKIG